MKRMRKIHAILGFILITVIQSCDYGVLYENPQPFNAKDLKEFPSSIIGRYRNDSLKETILIARDKVIKISEYDISVSRVEIDTMLECKLIGDSLFINELGTTIPVNLTKDSVFGILKQPDTLFIISKTNILRNFKNEYFLNLKHDSDYYWQVVRLRGHKNRLVEFSVVTHKIGYEQLNDLTPVKTIKDETDSIINFQINPTVKELKSIIEAGLFNTSEKFYCVTSAK